MVEYHAWCNSTIQFLDMAFGAESGNVGAVSNVPRVDLWPSDFDEEQLSDQDRAAVYEHERVRGLEYQMIMLGSCIEQLEGMSGSDNHAIRTSLQPEPAPPPVLTATPKASKVKPSGKVYGERWQSVGSLSEGGQAWTYLVTDLKGDSQTQYVLKRLKNTKRIARFRQEVEAVQSLNHENLVRIVDVNLENDPPYFVSEYLSGGDLSKITSRLQTDWSYTFGLFFGICKGISAAHAAGIVHRDIKPENILLNAVQDTAIVADFGICFVDGGERHTLTQEQIGARYFMAPELEDGRADSVTSRSDVYSLGKLLYWMLSGGRLFAREKHRSSDFDLVKLHGAPTLEHINRALDNVIVADPSNRPADAARLMDRIRPAIRAVLNGMNAPSSTLEQICTYCGQGSYALAAADNTSARNFGVNNVGAPDWRIMTCRACGHVQMFRLDYAADRHWWTS